MRRITGVQSYLVKNLYCCGMYGYHAVFQKEDKKGISRGYPYIIFYAEDFDVWDECEGEAPNIWSTVRNPDMLQTTRFKYSGYAPSLTYDVISYLNLYIEHPCVEYFGKMGIMPTITLIRKAEKDKAFRKWLYNNRSNCGRPRAILYAYKHKISVGEATAILNDIRTATSLIPEIKGTDIDRVKAAKYVRENKGKWGSYNDYLKAIKKLGLDLADTKNIFPHDFERMHDLRIAEYDSVMEKEDKDKRKKLYADFAEKAQDAKCFEYQNGDYAAVIPAQIGELVKEGRTLHHCVGKMGYDKKMADGEIIIVFVRAIKDLLKPLVTLEYDLKKRRILQAHGDHHRSPSEEEQAFITDWEKKTTEKLKVSKR